MVRKKRTKDGPGEKDGVELLDRSEGGASDGSVDDTAAAESSGDGEVEGASEPSEVEQLLADAQEWRLLAQRKQAELANYRKRVERERADNLKYAAAEVVKEILPILDNLERAVDAASSGGSEAGEQLREGVAIVCRQLRETLEKQGLEEVEALNLPFDPHVHEAVGRVPSPDLPEGNVVEVFQKGYKFKDRLLRPSMVTVAQSTDDDGGERS